MARVIDIIINAKSQLGVKEYPPNSNNVKYNTWFYGREVYDGLNGKTYPWCVVFIEWLFKDTKLLTRTASSTYLYNWFKRQNAIHSKPQPGDVAFFYFSAKKRPGVIAEHVGLVTEVSPTGIKTIEGNTSAVSQDNGGIVQEKSRKFSKTIVGYGRPQYDNAPLVGTVEKKTLEDIAQEVLQGKWGNGAERRQKLHQAGYDYTEVQKKVNEILKK